MTIDLHTHSNRSDGTDSPTELVAAAAAAGLTVLGLTDHDTMSGRDEAAAAAEAAGIRLVCGIEISTRNQGVGQHLLGYGLDPGDEDLVAMLARSVTSRETRVPQILARLADLGYPVELAEVQAQVTDGGTVGRPHIARVLVAQHGFKKVDDVFAELLGNDGPAYVARWNPEIEDAIALILAAGGVPVLAHPRGRRGEISDQRLAELTQLGLVGVEVDHQEHTPEVRAGLRGIAGELGLVMTGSSDYHGGNKTKHDLGCNTTAPEQLERLLAGVRVP